MSFLTSNTINSIDKIDKKDKKPSIGRHFITIEDRCLLELCGVEDVFGFDERSIVLKTPLGMLTIEGEGLHIKEMSVEDGKLTLDGRVDALFYTDKTQKKSGLFWKRRG